jgi:hypothetical protein
MVREISMSSFPPMGRCGIPQTAIAGHTGPLAPCVECGQNEDRTVSVHPVLTVLTVGLRGVMRMGIGPGVSSDG